MLPINDLLSQLDDINIAFQKETNNIKSNMWAKLAALDVCGWIEECIDKIVEDFLSVRNLSADNKKKVEARVKKINGFSYDDHFRPLMIELVGVIGFEKIEHNLSNQCTRLKSHLKDLKTKRDRYAHTFTKPLPTPDAPSLIISRLRDIEADLSAFNTELKKIELKP